MLADAVDGSLTAEEQAAFDLHLVGCASCTEMLANARRGAAWMEMLKKHAPEPPPAMLERILAQTIGGERAGMMTMVPDAMGGNGSGVLDRSGLGLAAGGGGLSDIGFGAVGTGKVLPFGKRVAGRIHLRAVGHTLLQPRLAMTAAMAFFSVALTLNLTGVRVSDLRVNDLKPSNLRRSVYQANAHVVRYVSNLREVYELESRVRDLQRSSESDTTAVPADGSPAKGGAAEENGSDPSGKVKGTEPKSQSKPRRASPGTSRREPLREDLRVLAGLNQDVEGPARFQCEAPATLFDFVSRINPPAQERGTV